MKHIKLYEEFINEADKNFIIETPSSKKSFQFSIIFPNKEKDLQYISDLLDGIKRKFNGALPEVLAGKGKREVVIKCKDQNEYLIAKEQIENYDDAIKARNSINNRDELVDYRPFMSKDHPNNK